MRVRILFHQYRLVLPVTQEMRAKTVQEFTDFVGKYLQQHFSNEMISIRELSTSDRYALNPIDIIQDVIVDNEVIICLDDQLVLDREMRVYCDRKNPWLHIERKKQPKAKKRRASTAGASNDGGGRKTSIVSIPSSTELTTGTENGTSFSKWAEVGYNTRNKVYVMLGVGNNIQLFLFSVDELRSNGFQEKHIGIIEDETGEWYTMAKFEKERPEKLKRSTEESENQEERDEVIAAIGLHVKAEGDQMANAGQVLIRIGKDGLLTTDTSEVVHLFGTKSGKRPRRKRRDSLEDEAWLNETPSPIKIGSAEEQQAK